MLLGPAQFGDRVSQGVLASIMRVHTALRDPAFRAAPVTRDLQLQIESYCQVPAAAALPGGR